MRSKDGGTEKVEKKILLRESVKSIKLKLKRKCYCLLCFKLIVKLKGNYNLFTFGTNAFYLKNSQEKNF